MQKAQIGEGTWRGCHTDMVAWLACEQERLSAVLKRLTTLVHVQDMSEVLMEVLMVSTCWCTPTALEPIEVHWVALRSHFLQPSSDIKSSHMFVTLRAEGRY